MTPSLFDPGLEAVTVAETELARVGEDGHLLVRGFPIAELAANASYEEVVFLLFHGRLPGATELDEFRTDLASRRSLSDEVRAVLRRAAAEGRSAMDALRMGLAAADIGNETADHSQVARRVVAVVPTVIATYWRAREGLDPVPPRTDLGHAANYLSMLSGEEPSTATVRGIETFLATTAEHGLNTSTFAARVVASTESDLVSAATAAAGALKGPLHGGQLDRTRELVWAAHAADSPATYVRERLRDDDSLPGFGHRVYEVRDPRAAVLAATAERFYEETGEDDFLDTVRTVESVATEALADSHDRHRPQATVDFYAAALLHGLDVPGPLLPATFAVARVGGWMAHCLEQRDDNRLVRPVARYVGATGRTWTPVDERQADSSHLATHTATGTLEPISETLATLSEPARLEILLALVDGDDPLAYSTLKDATSIEDKGRFNYHLRKLRGYFVRNGTEGYVLTDAGRSVVDAIVTDDALLDAVTEYVSPRVEKRSSPTVYISGSPSSDVNVRPNREQSRPADRFAGGGIMSDTGLNRGLEGVTVAETRLSRIDGENGELVVSGFPIEELATRASYEESLFLLLYDRLPTATEHDEFRADLAARREIGDEVRAVLRRAAAEDESAMDALRMGVAAATLGTDDGDPDADARRVVAVFPTVVATYWRFRQDEEPLAPRSDLSHAANYLYMLTGEVPTDAAVRGLETYLNTVIDHGLNASTFTARAVVSTESDLVSAATAAVGSLKGPLHGGAPGPVLDMLRAVHDDGNPEGFVRDKLDAGERLMGFGHRVYSVRDPRAAVLSTAAERFYEDAGDADFFATVREFETVAVDLLAEHKPGRALETNVEFYTAALLHGIGIPQALFTTTFAVARVGGWMAHCLEQKDDNRLVRPVSRYVGETDRAWTPVDER